MTAERYGGRRKQVTGHATIQSLQKLRTRAAGQNYKRAWCPICGHGCITGQKTEVRSQDRASVFVFYGPCHDPVPCRPQYYFIPARARIIIIRKNP